MKTLSNLKCLGLLVLLGALPACSKTTMNAVERADPVGQKQMVNDKRVLTDASLGRKVYVVGVNEEITAGGVLRVQVGLYNRTRSNQRFNYRFEWFDQSGMEVGASSALRTEYIAGGENKNLSSVAPTPACKDFRLKLIEPSN